MPERDLSFLVLRLGSLGDIVHTLPAVAALRDTFRDARIAWVVERRWRELLNCWRELDEAIVLERGTWSGLRHGLRRLRSVRYTCAIDFQGLYKSAILGWLSAAERRIGFGGGFAREPAAALFYTERVRPEGRHIIDQNLELAIRAGAQLSACRFSLRVPAEAKEEIGRLLDGRGVRRYFVFSPGGGWRAKCWPPEHYGELCRLLVRRYDWRAVVNVGPEERELGEAVLRFAGSADPILLSTDIPQLMALLDGAQLVVAGDTGPLHLAVALGTPVVGLYGPTDPARNGPYSADDVVVRNALRQETTHQRGRAYSSAMLSISVEQVLAAVDRRLTSTAKPPERQRETR